MDQSQTSPERAEASASKQEVSSLSDASGKKSPRARLTGFVAYIVLLVIIFIKPLVSLFVYVAGSELHSYIILVPFVSLYLLYLRYKRLPPGHTSSPGLAIVPAALGVAALVGAWQLRAWASPPSDNDSFTFVSLSFVCFLAAGGFLFLGKKWMAAAAFPFAFLIFMVPLPAGAVDWLETASKLASTEAADLFFVITGTPFLRYGSVFELPGIAIQVAQECSGIRSSWILLITSLLAANLFLESPWRRVAIAAVVIPLGIIRNGFRIFVIGSLCIRLGPQMIHSVIHKRGGPLFFALSLIPLFLLLWWLRRGELKSGRSKRSVEKAIAKSQPRCGPKVTVIDNGRETLRTKFIDPSR